MTDGVYASRLETFKDAIAAISKAVGDHLGSIVDKQLDELALRTEALAALEARMADEAATADAKITLNVGGSIFATSRETLLQFEGSYFAAMLSSGSWQPGDDGAYFIDRDPRHFERVMAFLRSGAVDFDGLDRVNAAVLCDHFDYFLLPLPPVTWDGMYCHPQLTLSETMTVATADGSLTGKWNVLATRAVLSFTVKLPASHTTIDIGYITRDQFYPSGTPGTLFFTWDTNTTDTKGRGIANPAFPTENAMLTRT
ncbi:hypothetical protein SPRG_12873 [Saprolegnia parasitica CBS 223.65]|uniref:BTB domain-containing protein n=1 Tax=Saprolegnia parasitica (strain CBS 223.65) TaxID=695850 RepID=A0A067BTP7_SAPPC|nr:hypothetical protein SPRG_12873 [Saprolegnia parasitica CBS 223.65]KDO21633.1 hypothetical protein SPRG_12873 [Saprolegnia parasitica CBS 223.65]|eukprot:XP_012207645.1 hypothetical protein SPRG_12873 [Saprolegnia parasitica CBS 223.65]